MYSYDAIAVMIRNECAICALFAYFSRLNIENIYKYYI